jgi:hypothetical protein
MKFFFLVLVSALTSLAVANAPAAKTTSTADWKVISETENCPKKIQIKAKAGEKYVIAVDGKTEYKLLAANGAGFDPSSMNATEYTSEKNEKMKDAVEYSFIQPSYVENRPAKLQYAQNGKMDRCPLIAK